MVGGCGGDRADGVCGEQEEEGEAGCGARGGRGAKCVLGAGCVLGCDGSVS